MDDMAYEHIQKEIKSQRKTQIEMAKMLGRTHAVATNIFNGERPIRVDEVPKLASWLKKSPNWILYGQEEPSLMQLIERISVLEQAVLQLTTEIGRLSRRKNEVIANA